MSAKGRAKKDGEAVEKDPFDNYPTPAWATHRLVDGLIDIGFDPGGDQWLEPCAGDGAIIRAMNERWKGIDWLANDIRPETASRLRPLAKEVYTEDFTAVAWPRVDVVVTNPPYSHAQEIIEASFECSRYVIMLLRINFWGAVKREEFFAKCVPNWTLVLPNRPPFKGKGTDATEYAWMLWDVDHPVDTGAIRRLALTPEAVRKRR